MNFSSTSNVSPGIRRVGSKTFVKWPVSVSSFRFTFAPSVDLHLISQPRSSRCSRPHHLCSPQSPSGVPHQFVDTSGDFVWMCFQREVTGVEKAHRRVGVIALKRLCATRNEKRIILAPDNQRRWLRCTEIFLKLWIQ